MLQQSCCTFTEKIFKPALSRYHGSRRLMASSDPGSAVSSSVSSVSPTLFVATLSLRRVTKEHRGNYSCSPSNAKAARVRLHVIDGKRKKKLKKQNTCNYRVR